MHTILETHDLKAYYISQAYGVRRTVKAVDGISLAIQENEVYGVAGESGCGKSTLLKVLLRMVTPPLTVVGGEVNYEVGEQMQNILTMSEVEFRDLRWKEISYLPQGSMHVLNPVKRIRDTFRDFIKAHTTLSTREMDTLVRDYLHELGLPDKVIQSFPHQLSGGMRQRVTIALATILAPRVVLADEPTTALDVVVQRGVIQLLEEIRQRSKSTIVLVTHDMGVHANFSERIGVLYAGKLIEEADTQTIFNHPVHPYTQHLIRSLPKLDDKSTRLSIPGKPPALDNLPGGCSFHPRCPYAMEKCKIETPPLELIESGHRAACFLVSGQ